MAGLKTFSTADANRGSSILKDVRKYFPEKTQLDLIGYPGGTGSSTSTSNSNNSNGSNSSGSKGLKTNSNSSSSSYSGTGAMINAADLYAAQMAAQQAAANEAYNNTMARIADAYGSASGNIRGNYDSSVSRLKSAMNQSKREVNSDAEASLRQAYINNELTKRNLNQRLSAMGYNGGATESTMANLANEYANSRTDINKTLNRNLSNLEQTYGDNLASALQAYNNAMNNLNMQRMQMENSAETARANMTTASPGLESLLSMDQNYVTALQNALLKQGAYTYDATEATNDFVPGNVQQASSAGQSTNYAKALSQAEMWANQGASAQSIVNNLYSQVDNGTLDLMTVAQIRQQLGI